jgi:hypothetical protein
MYSRECYRRQVAPPRPTASVVYYWTKSTNVCAVLDDFVQLVLRKSFIVCFTFRIHSSFLLT